MLPSTSRSARRLLAAFVALGIAGGTLLGTAAGASAAQAPPAHHRPSAAVPLADPTPEEQALLRELAGAIWTPELAAGWNMNSDVADVLSRATGAVLDCSKAFALVPRPPKFVPGLSYLVQYAKQLKDYFLVLTQDRSYEVCVRATALNHRSAIEMASIGI
jgi:hypothetical protein